MKTLLLSDHKTVWQEFKMRFPLKASQPSRFNICHLSPTLTNAHIPKVQVGIRSDLARLAILIPWMVAMMVWKRKNQNHRSIDDEHTAYGAAHRPPRGRVSCLNTYITYINAYLSPSIYTYNTIDLISTPQFIISFGLLDIWVSTCARTRTKPPSTI